MVGGLGGRSKNSIMRLEHSFCVMDLETGGLSPNKCAVTEIAIIVLDNNFNVVKKYGQIVAPYGEYEHQAKAMEITGLTMDVLMKEGKGYMTVYKEVEDILKSAKNGKRKPVIVGHNIAFDLSFLREFFRFCGGDFDSLVEPVYIDTMWMMRLNHGHEDLPNHKLSTCCEILGVTLTDAHRALQDTMATADLFRSLVMESRNGKVVSMVNTREKARATFRF